MYTEKDNKVIKILGAKWRIKFVPDNELLDEMGADGACDNSTRLIRVCKMESGNLGDLAAYQKKVLRHEIIHAFLFESGLAESTLVANQWAKNEEMVDYFAYQHDKIHKAFKKAGAL